MLGAALLVVLAIVFWPEGSQPPDATGQSPVAHDDSPVEDSVDYTDYSTTKLNLDLLEVMTNDTGITQPEAEKAVESLIRGIQESLGNGRRGFSFGIWFLVCC